MPTSPDITYIDKTASLFGGDIFKKPTKGQAFTLNPEQARAYGFKINKGESIQVDYTGDEPQYTLISTTAETSKVPPMETTPAPALPTLPVSTTTVTSKSPTPSFVETPQQRGVRDITPILKTLFPSYFMPGDGFFEDKSPDMVLQDIINKAKTDPAGLIKELQASGYPMAAKQLLEFLGIDQATIDTIINPPVDQIPDLMVNIPQLKGYTPDSLATLIQNDSQGFIDTMREGGRTPEKENLLSALGFNTETVNQIFAPLQINNPFGQALMKALPMVVNPNTLDWAVDYFSKSPDKLRRELITEGRNADTEALVRSLYPQISEQGMKDYFSPDFPEISGQEKPLEGGAIKVGPVTLRPSFIGSALIEVARNLGRTFKRVTTGEMVEIPPPENTGQFVGQLMSGFIGIGEPITITELQNQPGWQQALMGMGIGGGLETITRASEQAAKLFPSMVKAAAPEIKSTMKDQTGAARILGKGELPKKPVTPEVAKPPVAATEGAKPVPVVETKPPVPEVKPEAPPIETPKAAPVPAQDIQTVVSKEKWAGMTATEKESLLVEQNLPKRLASGSYENMVEEARYFKPAPVKTPGGAVPPEKPPAGVVNGGQAPIPSPGGDPVDKLTQMVKNAKPARKATEALKHEELSQRVAIAAKTLEQGQGYEAFARSKGALKGQLPQADFINDPAAVGLTQADADTLFNMINRKGELQYFQKLNTAEALNTVLKGQIPTEGQLILLENMYGKDLIEALLSKRGTLTKVAENVLDVLNIPRALETMADLSASLRQGIVLAAGQPVEWSQAFANQLKVIFSTKNAEAIDVALRQLPHAGQAEEAGLYLAPWGKTAPSLASHEESFMTRLIQKVPVIGSIVRASERTYVTFLNSLRSLTFEHYAQAWEGTAKSIKDYKDLASFINKATGRGNLGRIGNAGAVLNAAFFSPKFIASRVQLPLALFTSTPAVRKIAARNLVSFVGSGMTALGLAKLAGAEVEMDPRSTDFGKLKIGNTRYEFWGGFQPYARMVVQVVRGQRKLTTTGQLTEANRKDVIETFLRSKLAPVPGLTWDLADGKTFIGEDLTPENAPKLIYEKVAPMFLQDITDAVKDVGLVGIPMGLPSTLGIGVQTYDDNWNTNADRLGLPINAGELSLPIIYNTKDFYSDTISQVGQAEVGYLKKKADIPAKVIAVAEARDVKTQLGAIRGQKLTEINTDPAKGDTYEQLYQQWKERQQIVATGDDKALKAFDKLYPHAKQGNMTQREYALLKQYVGLSEAAQPQFLKANPELKAELRQEWLKANPKENAKLALFDQATVLTKEAYEEVLRLAKELDIPDNAVPDLGIPKDSVDNYFKYQDLKAKGESDSPEGQLLLAKDKGLRDFLGLKLPSTPVAALELKVKNKANYEKLASFSDNASPNYIPDFQRRSAAVSSFKETNAAFMEDLKRIEAIDKGLPNDPTPDPVIQSHVEYGKLLQKPGVGASSPEVMLFRVENPQYDAWRTDSTIWGGDAMQPVDQSKVPMWQIDVKYSSEDLHYNYLPVGQARTDYLASHPEYAKARIQRDGYRMGLTGGTVDQWVEYNNLPDTGFWKERYRLEHPDFDKAVGAVKTSGWAAVDPAKVPNVAYDQIYEKYKDTFTAYEDGDGDVRARIFELNPAFKEAYYRREAYGKLLPESQIDNYVAYNLLPDKGYAQERFMKEHQDFYALMRHINKWTSPVPNWKIIPSEWIESLYNQYLKLPTTGAYRSAFRRQHLDLDAWMYLAGKVSKPVTGSSSVGTAPRKTAGVFIG